MALRSVSTPARSAPLHSRLLALGILHRPAPLPLTPPYEVADDPERERREVGEGRINHHSRGDLWLGSLRSSGGKHAHQTKLGNAHSPGVIGIVVTKRTIANAEKASAKPTS